MIYFTKNLLTDHVKISYSRNERTLYASFLVSRIHNSGQLEVVAIYEGDILLKKELIKEYKFNHIRGLWYEYEDDMLNLNFSSGNLFKDEPTLKTKINKHIYKLKRKFS